MSEALKKLEQLLFARKIRRLEIECVVSNQPSANVALRNGYEKECIKNESAPTLKACTESLTIAAKKL